MMFSIDISSPNSPYRFDEDSMDLEESLVKIRYGFLIKFSLSITDFDLGNGPDELI